MVMDFVMGPWDGLTLADEKSAKKRFSDVKFGCATSIDDDDEDSFEANVVRITYSTYPESNQEDIEYLTCWYMQKPDEPDVWIYMQYAEETDEELQ